jgi:hypothetical protein
METRERTAIQKAIDLLEENGFYVFKAEEERPNEWTVRKFKKGVIVLRITPREDPGELSYASRY